MSKSKNYLETYIVLLDNSNNGLKIPFDEETGDVKRFVFYTGESDIKQIVNLPKSKKAISEFLLGSRYFWEFLIEIGFSNSIRVLYIEFIIEGKQYTFSYLAEEDIDQYWIALDTYSEEFGELSDFDYYSSSFGQNSENFNYIL